MYSPFLFPSFDDDELRLEMSPVATVMTCHHHLDAQSEAAAKRRLGGASERSAHGIGRRGRTPEDGGWRRRSKRRVHTAVGAEEGGGVGAAQETVRRLFGLLTALCRMDEEPQISFFPWEIVRHSSSYSYCGDDTPYTWMALFVR